MSKAEKYGNGRGEDEADVRFAVPGAKVKGRRLVPDEGCQLEQSDDDGTILLRNTGGGPGASVSCTCGLEGGGCTAVIIGEGPDQYAVCLPDRGCGTSGLFCFMDFDFGGGVRFQVRM